MKTQTGDDDKPVEVLLVEDSPTEAGLIKATLDDQADFCFETTWVETLKKASECLDSQSYDIVVLDLTLPDSKGLGTFLEIHKSYPDVPTVVLTASNSRADAIESIRQGAQDYIVKEQVENMQLILALRYAIERQKAEETLRLQAITDSLTGLWNRRHFYELAEIEISRSLRYSRPLSVMMYDIDFFKRINDTFGHLAGDMVLKTVSEISRKGLRASDIVARYGGEEFIVFLPETSASEAATAGEKLRKQIENATIESENRQISITASFGVSDCLGKPSSGTNKTILSEFISSADQALYASKNAGRNRVTVYEPKETSSP